MQLLRWGIVRWKSLQRLAIMAGIVIGGSAHNAAGGLLACINTKALTSAGIA